MARWIALVSAASVAFAGAALAEPAGAPSTQHFITAASQSDEFERREGRLAEQDGVGQRVKAFAAQMVHDHTMTTGSLHAAIQKAGLAVPPPPPLSAMQQNEIDSLKGLRGAAFDHAYVNQQIRAHEEALGLLQAYARKGDNPDLGTAAQQTIPLVKHHLEMARSLQQGT
jgi:putative membrane protein